MANYNNLKAGIDAVIKTNGRQEISGAALNTQLKNMIAELGAGYQYMGVATPATNPGTPDANVFYLASEAGTYTNFGGIVINEGEVCALVWNGTWTKQVTGAASADKLSQLGQKVDGKEINLLKLPGVEIIPGERIANAGYTFADPLYWRTNAIPVTQGMNITSVAPNTNIAFHFFFYNSATISSETYVGRSEGRTATVPAGASYMALYMTNDNIASSCIVCDANDITGEYPILGQDTSLYGVYYKNQLDEMFSEKADKTYVENEIDVRVGEIYTGREINILNFPTTEIIHGERIASAGYIILDENYWRTNLIPVKPGEEYAVATSNSAQTAHFYFFNDDEISGSTIVSDVLNNDATVPAGASYMSVVLTEIVFDGAIVCNIANLGGEMPVFGMDTIVGAVYTKKETDEKFVTKSELPGKWYLGAYELNIVSVQQKAHVLCVESGDVLFGTNGYRDIFKATKIDLSDAIVVYQLPSLMRLNNLLFISEDKAVGYVVGGDAQYNGFWLFENCDTNSWTGRKTGQMDYGFPGNNFQSLAMADNGYIFASEYSIKSPEHPSNKIYRSTDGGETWSACYTHLTAENTHMHAITFDPYRQRVWCVIGDAGNGGRPGWVYSDDYGNTWIFVEGEEGQGAFMDTAIIPTRKYVLVGSDAHPAGLRKWQPTTDTKHAPVLASEVTHFYDLPFATEQNFGFARNPIVDTSKYPYRIVVSFSYDQTYSHACLIFSPDFQEWIVMDYVEDPRTNLFFSVLNGITSDGWVLGYDESHEYYRYFKYPDWVNN